MGTVAILLEFKKTFTSTPYFFHPHTVSSYSIKQTNTTSSLGILRHPTDEQLQHVDIYFLATKIIFSLSTLNCIIEVFVNLGLLQRK